MWRFQTSSRAQRGMTLMEIVIVLAITTVILLISYQMMESAVQTSLFVESHNDLPVLGQQVANHLQRELMQARAFFNTTDAGTYLDSFRRPDDIKLVDMAAPNSVLPNADTSQEAIVPDTSTQFVGNSLLIARQLAPILVDFDHDGLGGTPVVQFPADVYEFQYYFLARDTDRNFSSLGYYLDLMMGQSVRYADFFQLNSLSAAQRVDLHPRLIDDEILLAWDPSAASFATAFFDINTDGTLTALGAGHIIRSVRVRSLLPAMAGGRISGFMNYSVATLRPDGTPFPIRHPVGQYSIVNPSVPAYPSGFEVKLVGPAGFRRAFVRVLLMSHYGVTRYDSAESFVLTSVRF